jgi:hypothetical protein
MSTSINSSTGLPDIPTLPPLEIPIRPSLDRHLPLLDQDALLSPRAYSSLSPPLHRQPAGSSNDTPQSSPTNATPLSPNLRKSFSVDSFSRHSRSSPVSVVSRQQKASPLTSPLDEQHRVLVPTWQSQPVGSSHVSYLPRDPAFPLSGRSRGASVSTTGDEASQPILEESDGEPVHDVLQYSTGAKRTGTKTKGKLRPTLPPGELPLPSKLHGANLAVLESIDTGNDNAPWLPAIGTESVSHRNSKACPSNRHTREDDIGIGSVSTSGVDCGGGRWEAVSIVPSICLTLSDSTA